jgi:GrpB-like predicted nucleotidyltransferase (UPF0157 family)
MPFLDEDAGVVLTPYRAEWQDEYADLAETLRTLELSPEGMIEHVGSTSIPGLTSKDVIDAQIRVPELDTELVIGRFSVAGFRQRPEPWNNLEPTRLGVYPKLVFAPPLGARHANVHVRANGSPGAHDTLLFRDFLRVEDEPRRLWSELKESILRDDPEVDLLSYGQTKQVAWLELMVDADKWALEHVWRPRPLLAWTSI